MIPEKHRGIKWSKRDINSLISLYARGVSIPEISKNTGRTINAVQHKIKDLELTDRCRRWSEHEIAQIIKLKESGKTFKEIATIMNRSERGIQSKILRHNNPSPKKERSSKIPKNNRRVYPVKDDYFSVIDTQKKSYYLGFFMADGYVTSKINASRGEYNPNNLGIKLAIKDMDVLEDMKSELCPNSPIKKGKARTTIFRNKEIKSTESCTLRMSSEQIVKDLSKYGIIQNKTYICKFPEELNPKYYPGFISGLLSGDGFVGLKHNHQCTTPNLRSGFSGTKELVDGVRKALIDNIYFNADKKTTKAKQSKSLYTIELSKEETLRMYYWMKENGISLMSRKTKIIEDYIRDYPEKCREAV